MYRSLFFRLVHNFFFTDRRKRDADHKIKKLIRSTIHKVMKKRMNQNSNSSHKIFASKNNDVCSNTFYLNT